jgi:hypothetical protein
MRPAIPVVLGSGPGLRLGAPLQRGSGAAVSMPVVAALRIEASGKTHGSAAGSLEWPLTVLNPTVLRDMLDPVRRSVQGSLTDTHADNARTLHCSLG